MSLLRFLIGTFAILSVSAARRNVTDRTLTFDISSMVHRRNAQLQQLPGVPVQNPDGFLINPDQLRQVEVPMNLLSDECFDSLRLLRNEVNIISVEDVLFARQVQECIRVNNPAILADPNNVQTVINTFPCDVNANIFTLENTCDDFRGTVCDFTICEDLTIPKAAGTQLSRLVNDYYWCIPDPGCSFLEVERLAVFFTVALQDIVNIPVDNSPNDEFTPEPIVGNSVFQINAVCFDDLDRPRDFNGGSGYVTSISISGAGNLAGNGAVLEAIEFQSTDLNFGPIQAEVASGMLSGVFGKNAAAVLNKDLAFREAGCFADLQERAQALTPPQDQLNIFCATLGVINVRENPNFPGASNEPFTPLTGPFDVTLLGLRFQPSDSLSSFPRDFQVPLMQTNAPPADLIAPTLPNGQPIPTQVAIGNGPVQSVPIVTGASNAGASTKPTLMATAVCLAVAFVGRRFC